MHVVGEGLHGESLYYLPLNSTVGLKLLKQIKFVIVAVCVRTVILILEKPSLRNHSLNVHSTTVNPYLIFSVNPYLHYLDFPLSCYFISFRLPTFFSTLSRKSVSETDVQ